MTLAVFAKLTAKEGRGDELVAALQDELAAVHREPGTITYIAHRDEGRPDEVWFYELYTDQHAFEAHRHSDSMTALASKLAGLLDGPLQTARGVPLEGSKGVPSATPT